MGSSKDAKDDRVGYGKDLNSPKAFVPDLKMKPEKKKREPKAKEIRFISCWIAPFQMPHQALTYSTFGLGRNGCVYRFDPKCDAWIPWSMKIATCKNEHPHKR